MSKPTKQFDAADYLETPEEVAVYLDEAFATGDREFIMSCIETAVKSRVVSDVAAEANIHRVSLHKMLANRSNARLDSLTSILNALDCRLAVVPNDESESEYGAAAN